MVRRKQFFLQEVSPHTGQNEHPLHRLSKSSHSVFQLQSDLILKAGVAGVRFVLYAGRPLGEKIVSYGPFIADREEEIQPLYQKYRAGKMKHISTAPESQRITY